MYTIESKAFHSALDIYQKFKNKYPETLLANKLRRNGMKFYYYDLDYVVSNSGQPVIAFSEELPDDEFIMSDHKSIIAWKFNSHDCNPDYELFRLPSYNEYTLNNIYWCKKFGFMRRLRLRNKDASITGQGETYYEILEVYTDDGRPSEFVYVNSTRRHIFKIYLKEFERNYKKTLIKV